MKTNNHSNTNINNSNNINSNNPSALLMPWLLPWLKQSKRPLAVLVAFVFVCAICYIAAKDPKHILGTRDLVYSMVIVFFLGGAAFTVVPVLQKLDVHDTGRITPFMLVFLAITCGFLIVLQNASLLNVVAFQYVLWLLLAISLIVVVVYTFRTTMRVLIHLPGWLGFFFRFVFFVPCLLVDLGTYLVQDVQRSSRYVWALLFVEILFLVVYTAIHVAMKRSDADEFVFVGPTTLGSETVVLGRDRAYFMQTDKTTLDVTNHTIQRNYSISCWVNLNNTQGSLGADRSILYYGQKSMPPHLHLYVDSRDNNKTKLNYDGVHAVDVELSKQVWHQVVVTYDQQQVFVYTDGELRHVLDVVEPLSHDIGDKLVVGDTPALSGAICQVTYHRVPLSRDDVVQRYLLLKDRNPPVVDTTW